jgi:hypothetical protein
LSRFFETLEEVVGEKRAPDDSIGSRAKERVLLKHSQLSVGKKYRAQRGVIEFSKMAMRANTSLKDSMAWLNQHWKIPPPITNTYIVFE